MQPTTVELWGMGAALTIVVILLWELTKMIFLVFRDMWEDAQVTRILERESRAKKITEGESK